MTLLGEVVGSNRCSLGPLNQLPHPQYVPLLMTWVLFFRYLFVEVFLKNSKFVQSRLDQPSETVVRDGRTLAIKPQLFWKFCNFVGLAYV